MAENKRSFLLYTDVHFTVKKLTDEQSGKLFKHILSYVNDENPVINDLILEIAFEPIKQSLKRDLRKYEIIREKRSQAGKASADKRQQVLTSVEHDKQVLTHSTVNVNDNVNVNVKENNKKANKSPDFIDQILDCFIQEHGSYELLNKGKERNAIAKILQVYKEKYPAATSEETIEGLRAYFKQCINIPDVWLMNNMSPSIIVSKFNEINKILRNGTYKKTVGATNQQLAELLAIKLGSDSPANK